MALRGFTDVILEGGITEIVTVSSLASVLHFALGLTEGSGMSPPSSSAYFVIVFKKFAVKYPGHYP